MWTPRAIAVLIALLLVVPLAHAQAQKPAEVKAPDAKTQEFRVEDVGSLADVPVAQLKPRTIVFADHPPENLVDPGTGFMRYEDWAKARPLEQQFLSLYPGYSEPDIDLVVDGVKKRFKEKLHMYVASARFVLARQPGSLDLARLVTLPFVEQIDPAIKHRVIGAGEVTATQDPKVIFNQNPKRNWCEGRPTVLCVRSHYKLEGRFPLGIQLANKIRDSAKPVSDILDFESEFTVRSPAEVEQSGLDQIDRPRHALGRRDRAEHFLRQPGDAVRQAAGGVPAASGRPEQDRGDGLHGARDRVERARQEEGIRHGAGAAESRAGSGPCGQELVQYRQVAQCRPAGLCAQQRQGDRRPDRA